MALLPPLKKKKSLSIFLSLPSLSKETGSALPTGWGATKAPPPLNSAPIEEQLWGTLSYIILLDF